MKTIAILITVHNRKQKTYECLSLINKQDNYGDFQIDVFVTNDGCTDGTLEMIRENFNWVNIVQGDGNLFWNRGMHKAWEAAKNQKVFDYYLWLNDDTYLNSNAIKELLSTSQLCNDKAIIVGTTVSSRTNSVTYGGRTKAGQLIIPNGLLEECHHFNGNIVLVTSFVHKILGNLDPIFHHTLGDFDYGMRAEKKKIKRLITPVVLGCCELHDSYPNYFSPTVPLINRIKSIYKSSSGCNPNQQFIFENRHYGFLIAIFHWCTIHLRVLFPSIMNKRKSLQQS